MNRAAEDEMIRQNHQLSGHKFEQTPGDSEGQGSLACCSPWGLKELDMTERLNHNNAETKQEGTNGLINSKKTKLRRKVNFTAVYRSSEETQLSQ